MKNLWYISSSNDGRQNLAIDEWFLDNIGPDDLMLYFYINQDAVIIGRNQNPWKECNLTAMDEDHVQLVRRITGGGAVFHDKGNLNFSFIAGEKRYDLDKQLNLILHAVSSFGIQCEFTGRNDLLAYGKKFSGNAFCARRNIRQHHGTLLLNTDLSRLQNYLNVDPKKIKAKSINSVRSRVCNLSEFSDKVTTESMLSVIRNAYEQLYGTVEDYNPTDKFTNQVKPYYEKHSSWQWLMGNTMPFDIELDNRFTWGGVQMQFSIKKAIVENVQVYSDAIDTELSKQISDSLRGCRFTGRDLHDALISSEKQIIRDVAVYLLDQRL